MTHLWHFLAPNPAFRWNPKATNWAAVGWFLLLEIVQFLIIEKFDHWFSHWSAAGWGLVSFGVLCVIFRPNDPTVFVIVMGMLAGLFLPGKKSQ